MSIASIPPRGDFAYPDGVRSGMRRMAEISAFDRALATAAGRAGLFFHFDPADFADGRVLDRAGLATWDLLPSGTMNPTVTTIGTEPALQFTQGTSRVFQSSVPRPNGAFTFIIVRSQTANEAAVPHAVMFSTGPDLSTLCHARQDGSMRFYGTTAQPGIQSGHADGTYIEVFAYDDSTDVGRIFDQHGAQLGNDGGLTHSPATASKVQIGGWTDAYYGFSGKIGRVLVFAGDLSETATMGAMADVLALLRAQYGLS